MRSPFTAGQAPPRRAGIVVRDANIFSERNSPRSGALARVYDALEPHADSTPDPLRRLYRLRKVYGLRQNNSQ